MNRFKISILLFFSLLIFKPLLAQQIKIEGKIIDVNTHRAVPYANIFVKDSKIGTISDFSGHYSLTIPKPHSKMIVIVQHINYDMMEIAINDFTTMKSISLQPRVIPLPMVEVEAIGQNIEIDKDLPQTISIIKADDFDIRGFVDAGDLLQADHSVKVDEELSGKKTISIRAGNPDDVIVLYNGIKLNSEFNNIFDFSLIDLEDIERFEVIKGSNTALYGSEAFSGVINIVPKSEQDYTIRVQQRIGTYDSGNYGIHLYQRFNKLRGSYRLRQGGAKRNFADAEDDEYLENLSTHHTANLEYVFSEKPGGIVQNSLSATYMHSSLDYNDYRDDEKLSNSNQILGLNFHGDIYKLKNLNLTVSQHILDESQSLSGYSGGLDRDIKDNSLQIHTEKTFEFKNADILFAYQYENAKLDFFDQRTDFSWTNIEEESATLERHKNGVVSILKIHAPSGSNVVQVVDFDLSYRYDHVMDDFKNYQGQSTVSEIHPLEDNEWKQSILKFASVFSGYNNDYAFNFFMNIGKNVKFPTLSQIISSRFAISSSINQPALNPEKNQSVELAFVVKRELNFHPTIYGWQLSGNYMKNYYENKFITYYTPGSPIAFYDNVQDAKISGFETKATIFLLKKKVSIDLGLSKYSIPEKSAFPFKYDMKRTVSLSIDHAGYSFQLNWFNEGEQIGWIRQFDGQFSQVDLPEFSSINVHLSKNFQIGKLKLFGNFSGRNLLNDSYELQGIALRDRRFYFTFGAQY